MQISLAKAVALLKEGNVVAIPTETVYGLAGSLYSPEAIKTIFSLKNRPLQNPLIVHVQDRSEAYALIEGEVPALELLFDAFWPGPLTVVVPAKKTVPEIVRAGLSTVAIRMPSHTLALAILHEISPLVAPSANLSGKPSATTLEHVEHDFGSSLPVIDGGKSHCGVESTILIYTEDYWHLGRKGAISQEEIAEVLGYIPQEHVDHTTPLCPGQLFSHYAPKAQLVLSNTPYTQCSRKQPCVLGFTDREYPEAEFVISLGASSQPAEVAHRLYHSLRILDLEQIESAWVDINVPSTGMWTTILERLTKAAAR